MAKSTTRTRRPHNQQGDNDNIQEQQAAPAAAVATAVEAPRAARRKRPRLRRAKTSPASTPRPTPSTSRSRAASSTSKTCSRWTSIGLHEIARQEGIQDYIGLKKQDLIFQILRSRIRQNGLMYGEGVLEILPDGFGFLRSPDYNYLPCPDDIYI